MNIQKAIVNNIPLQAETTAKFGKHKIPRFIYHLTTKDAYDTMLKDGFIKTSIDNTMGKGIFMTDLNNLFKDWGRNKAWGNDLLIGYLVDMVSIRNKDIVLLKIPTAKLDHDKLVIRSQKKLFEWLWSKKEKIAYSQLTDFMKKNNIKKDENYGEIAVNFLKKFLSENYSQEYAQHITGNTPAKFCHLYKQKHEAIEYAYKSDIDMSDVSKIGEINITQVTKAQDFDSKKPARSVFMKLLEGTPEIKAAERIKY